MGMRLRCWLAMYISIYPPGLHAAVLHIYHGLLLN